MDLGTKNLNDLISKDDNASNTAAKRILDNCDVESFEKLCEKSEFLFDYIKEKILKNLVCAADKDNFLNTFKFIKIYNIDFEDFIIKVYHGDTFGNYNVDKPNFVGDTKSIASGEKLEYSYR